MLSVSGKLDAAGSRAAQSREQGLKGCANDFSEEGIYHTCRTGKSRVRVEKGRKGTKTLRERQT